MGRQISQSQFTESDFRLFKERLRQEMSILNQWFREKIFLNEGKATGIEVEFWLVDQDFLPAPRNTEYLALAADPQIVTETSKFNAEINTNPVPLTPDVLKRSRTELERLWNRAEDTAKKLGLHAVTIGSLPTIRDTDLRLENLSDMERYRALNSQVMRMRKGRPVHLDIEGKDRLEVWHEDVMLEAAATSLQCHFQVESKWAAQYYNASLITSIPLVALAANSPYLFGNDLWDETRIPIFEQSMRLPCFSDPDGMPVSRVGLGSGYVRESLLECFLENLDAYPILMPALLEEKAEWLPHLRFHNGNIWRWNRPIIGLTRHGKPHLRIEQRSPGSGPTLADMIANFAFFLGFTHWLAIEGPDLKECFPFEKAKTAFYAAARHGLFATIPWFDGQNYELQSLLTEQLIPRAREGLIDLGVQREDIENYIDGIILPRARAGRTGAAWQRAYVSTHGKDFQGLVEAYVKNQESALPVHEWNV